jgi:transcriptional regulator of met regulon
MSYADAKKLMRELGISSQTQFNEWLKSGERPGNFPSNPARAYKAEWQGFGEFLGTGRVYGKDFMSYADAKKLMRELGISSQAQFLEWSRSDKRPGNFPSNPRQVYKTEWQGFGEFFGTGRVYEKDFMPYADAKKLMRELGISSQTQFKEWSKLGKRPGNLPSQPSAVYTAEWQGWGEFFGTGRVREKDFMSYADAQDLIHELGISSHAQFQKWSKAGKRPGNFPSHPQQVYTAEWQGWGEFLGTGRVSKKDFTSYAEAQKLMRELGISSQAQFNEWSKSGKRPGNFPGSPPVVYTAEWQGWGEFLGTGRVSAKDFMSYADAKKMMRELGISSSTHFREWSKSGKRPGNFPGNPPVVYKTEWQGWGEFLGTGR